MELEGKKRRDPGRSERRESGEEGEVADSWRSPHLRSPYYLLRQVALGPILSAKESISLEERKKKRKIFNLSPTN